MEEGDTNDIARLESLADEYEELSQDQENQNASDGGSGTADENGRGRDIAGQEQEDEVDHVMEAIRAALARRRPSPNDPYSSRASDWGWGPNIVIPMSAALVTVSSGRSMYFRNPFTGAHGRCLNSVFEKLYPD